MKNCKSGYIVLSPYGPHYMESTLALGPGSRERAKEYCEEVEAETWNELKKLGFILEAVEIGFKQKDI